MTSEPAGVSEIVRAWIAAHPVVDFALGAALVALFALICLVCGAAIVYWFWYLLRLLRPKHVVAFLGRPIPGIRKGKFGTGEIEMEGLSDLPAFERGTVDALAGMSLRVAALEKSLKAVEIQVGRYEDVSGRA